MHHAALPAGGDLGLLFLASLLGSTHCIAMCGPYVTACAAQFVPQGATAAARLGRRSLFVFGRLLTYMLIGAGVGAFGQVALAAANRAGLGGILAILAGLVTLLFAASLLGWIADPTLVLARAGLQRLLLAGSARVRQAAPLAMPLLLGGLQGLLPCALVYAAASRAAVAGSAGAGILTMAVFGLGTVPAVFALTLLPVAVLRRAAAQRIAGVLLGVLGALLVLRGLAGLGLIGSTLWW
jgi:sulfite exporter TauE/SafE